jgi:hypothetical protein
MGKLEQDRVGGATTADVSGAGPAQMSVGKQTQVEAANQGAPGAPGTPGVRPPTPPEFAGMDHDLLEKLWSSRATLATRRDAFRGKSDDQFWDAIREIGAADLHTLQVVARGAKSVGVWPTLQTIVGWYTYGSSYAIEFLGTPASVTGSGAWGKDAPQSLVRAEHRNSAHEWYRNNSGPGNPGMHLGLDVGAGYHNIHWDPTNPMDHVGDGGLHLGLLGLSYEPRGIAIYSVGSLISHAAEIGKFGETAQSLLAKPNTPTEKFLRISSGKESADKANAYADMETRAAGKTDVARSGVVCAEVRRTAAAILAIHTTAQSLAMTEDAAAESSLDALLVSLDTARTALWRALAAFIVYLKSEAGETGDIPYDTETEWANNATWRAYDTIVDLHRRREARSAAPH